jgi:hypothetical protein
MSYAYSRAIDYVVNLIEERDFEIDKEDIELPYIEYLLTDYIDQKEEDAKQLVAYNQSFDSTSFKPIDNKADNIKQLDLFADRLSAKCPHKDTMYDTGMQQTYCLECFNYIEEEDAYYHNSLGKGPGYY